MRYRAVVAAAARRGPRARAAPGPRRPEPPPPTASLGAASAVVVARTARSRLLGGVGASSLARDGTRSFGEPGARPATCRGRLSPAAAARGSASSSASGRGATTTSLLVAAAAASLAAAGGVATAPASCESRGPDAGGDRALTDEGDESDTGPGVPPLDGMDAGGTKTSSLDGDDNGAVAPAEAEEDKDGDGNGEGGSDDDDDDDDPSKDEDTTCSICLINRRGPCRRHWLKFERCMKEHGAEKDELERKQTEEEEEKKDGREDGDGEGEPSLEEEWDAFMLKSTNPGDDDDDDDDDDEDDDEDDDDEDADEDEDEDDSATADGAASRPSEPSLAERCDRHMIPWIGCIQEHRNAYSLISNEFYQSDYVDPAEDAVPESRRSRFERDDAEIGEEGGYLLKFRGVELDLGNWREHVEADADDFEGGGEGPAVPVVGEEPHLVNAYAKFRLVDDAGRPIEVGYVKDHEGRLLGFDSFSKRDEDDAEGDGGEGAGGGGSGAGATAAASDCGECTFHVVPGETTAIVAYAIYRGERKECGARKDFLRRTPEIPLPGTRKE
ncbi:hypothetical protein ACHAWF_013509 [Thalassiosira exigua]